MNLFDTIRNTLVPIHKEGYIFVAAFFVASLVLGWIAEPLFWIGMVLTAWCAYFFRDPERVTPQDDELIISPADGTVSAIQTVVPPLELELGKEPMVRVSVFMNVFNCHVNRSPVRGRIVNVAYRPGLFLNADLDKASEDNERNGLVIETAHGRVRRRADRWHGRASHRLLGQAERTGRCRRALRSHPLRFPPRYFPAGRFLSAGVGRSNGDCR